MKKIEIKKIVTTALIAVMGLFALVAMKPMRENNPIVGVFNGEPIVIEPCVGCPGSTVYTIKNNSKCKDFLKINIAFVAQQGTFETNPIAFQYFPLLSGTTNILNSEMSLLAAGMGIDVTQTYSLVAGGIDIYYFDPNNGINTVIGNILPGDSKTIHYVEGSSKVCECYKVKWDEATKTITIDDCE